MASCTASACSRRCCVMFGEVLDILAGRGGSGRCSAELHLPGGANETNPFFLSGWPCTSFQPIKAGWPYGSHSWGILVLSPSLGARETPPHTPANRRINSIYTWLWECVTHGSSEPQSVCVPRGPAPNKGGRGLSSPLQCLRNQHTEAETWPMS